MPYVKRDDRGGIAAVYRHPVEDGLEEVPDDNPELLEFFKLTGWDAEANKEFLESDLSLARVLEDLIDVLIQNKAMQFTDLPLAARKKLLSRRGLRKEFAYVEDLFAVDEEGYGDAATEREAGEGEFI
ncbi:MAG TPA: hypothetical protein ENI55_05805 [Alphaproteobacteria bacterium]|nr:hypothetical protein [Alphaproteobacteria bacterium]